MDKYLLSPLISLADFVQASVFDPSIFIAQDPQIPSRHDLLNVTVEINFIFDFY